MLQYVYIHIHYTHLYNWSSPSFYSSTAAYNNCYNELMCYTMLTLIRLVFMVCINAKATPVHDNDYSCHNSYRTCSTNHMWSLSCHIMPLVINILGTDTHTNIHRHTTHTHIQHLHKNGFKKPGKCQQQASTHLV